MSVGWAGMSMAAVNTIVAPWFERRRGLAISLALNGASLGGVLVAPPLIVLIGWLGFGPGLWVAAVIVLAILLPPVWMLLHRGPDALGLEPDGDRTPNDGLGRSEEHTSELQSLMRISYAVFCLKKKKT